MRAVVSVAIALPLVGLFACGDDDDVDGDVFDDATGTDAATADVGPPSDVAAALDGVADTGNESTPDDAAPADAADSDLSDGSDAFDVSDDVVGPDPAHPLLADGFLNIAHRGGGRLAPEETLAAYDNALAIGVDVIEIDVHSTSDGVIVCMHDDTVDRTTDGTGRIRSMTFDQLRALDAGYRFTRDGGATWPFRGQGLTVPTMDEVLDRYPDALVAIEIKQYEPGITEDVVALIEEHDAVGRVVVASFDDSTIAAVRRANPRILTALAAGEMLRFARLDDRSLPRYVPPAPVIQAPYDAADAELVALAHSLGMRVHLWTVNDRDEMEAAIALGVDGIFTDDPALLAEVLGEGSGDAPTPTP